MSEVKLIIGGDTVPTKRDIHLFSQGDTASLFGELRAEIKRSDFFVLNLECPLVDSARPIPKAGPNLKAPTACIEGLKIADVVNLSNNHIMDYGADGLFSTIECCRQNGIDIFGAGENLDLARKPLIRTVNGVRIGLFGIAENEFSIATGIAPGAYGLDIVDIVRDLRDCRDKMDFCIILYHGGNEHYPYPNSRLQKLCRFLVEQGADAVICQHSHCPGCYEMYQDKLIVYGQGNLIFDRPAYRNTPWTQGFLIRLKVSREQLLDYSLIPYIQSTSQPGIQRITGQQAEDFLAEIQKRSDQIIQSGFVDQQWNTFSEKMKDSYLGLMYLPQYRLFSLLNRKMHLIRRVLSQKKMKLLLNLIRCESHRDILLKIFDERKLGDDDE